jgi:UDP-glucose 4-epimerase
VTVAHRHPVDRKPARVVLIGARGFVGTAIRELLDRRGVDHLALTSTELDLLDIAAGDKLAASLRADDAVVMLAALTPDKGRDLATMMKNLTMMQNVCAAIGRTGCAHFVYFSSDAVYNTVDSRVTEETPPSPQDLYGAMHYTREIMARSLAKTPVLVLRPTLIYGLHDTHNSYGPNRFRRAAQKDGKIVLFGAGEEMRDHIHVDDVAMLTLRCLLRRSTGTLNVATGISHSFHNSAELVARQFGNAVEIAETPRANPVTHRHYDIADTIKAFPDIRFVSLQDGVARVHREMLDKG